MYRVQEADIGKKLEGKFIKKELLAIESNVNLRDAGNFELNLGENMNNGRLEVFLSEKDQFLINSLNVNINTTDDKPNSINRILYRRDFLKR